MVQAFGVIRQKLDEKGRIILPAKSRPEFAAGYFLAEGQDRCVFLFTDLQFQAYRDQMAASAPQGMAPIAFDRMFYSSVVAGSPDKQGRLNIPSELRTYASLVRDLVVVGLPGRMEVWDAGTWDAYRTLNVATYSSLTEGVR
jgi:MraZ protein